MSVGDLCSPVVSFLAMEICDLCDTKKYPRTGILSLFSGLNLFGISDLCVLSFGT